MAALDRVTGQTTSGAATSAASTAAAAWAPAATAASIASYGAASGVGLAAYLAAEAAGVAGTVALSAGGGAFGSAAEGGFTGGTEGVIGGFYHGQEFVFSAPAVRNIGVENLEAAHNSARGLTSPAPGAKGSAGGRVSPGQVSIAVFDDRSSMAKWLDSEDGQKSVIDLINRNRHSIAFA
jgi:hypothetical protein